MDLTSIRQIRLGDCLDELRLLTPKIARLIYIDPPFGSGKTQRRERIKVHSTTAEGTRGGFGGKRYNVESVPSGSFEDRSEDFESFLMPRIERSLGCLASDGSILIHLDPRWAHYVKVAMDRLLGRDHFMNEIIWSFDYGHARKPVGLPSTTTFCGMCSTQRSMSSSTMPSTGFRTLLLIS
jgi:site-specific DNA-methyltransferase (adenine-specific)